MRHPTRGLNTTTLPSVLLALTVLAGAAAVGGCGSGDEAEAGGGATTAMSTTIGQPAATTLETATFGAGCFWGVEAAFRKVDGVHETAVGYLGGNLKNPTYRDVCTGRTGHAEVVQVKYDPAKVSYEQLLDVFWKAHDPTTLNRQGPDVGTQYRSAVFFHTPEQEAAARASKEKVQASGRYRRDVVTEITAAGNFYMAEDYHQQYLAKRGLNSCGIGGL